MAKHSLGDLQQMQSLPLKDKIKMTQRRIEEWYEHYDGNVYVSFSGGKDSTVLLHLVREMYPDVPAVFVDTGLEYPEIRKFVMQHDNVTIIKPKMNLVQVIKKYGYPMFSKEVSECVYGARKYLTSLIESGSLDRPTCHTAIGTRELLEQEHIRSIKEGTHHPYQYETDRILGTCRPVKCHPEFKGDTTTSGVKLEELANTLNERMLNKMGGQNQRLAIMLGIPTKDKSHPIKANIPENDRSMFSQERYSFLLDAPFEISNMCCNVMKKEPAHRYQKEIGRNPITAQMASESRLRTQIWLKQGCNAFEAKKPMSNPMSFWTEQDVLLYLYRRDIEIASVYGQIIKENEIDGQMDLEDFGIFDNERPLLKTTGCERTGCFACGFGAHHEKECNCRIQKTIDFSNPNLADWQLRGGEFDERGLWVPKGGLGYWFIYLWIRKYGGFPMYFPNEEYYIKKYSTPETDRYLK